MLSYRTRMTADVWMEVPLYVIEAHKLRRAEAAGEEWVAELEAEMAGKIIGFDRGTTDGTEERHIDQVIPMVSGNE